MEEQETRILDLSGKNLKKIPKETIEENLIDVLILDNNELQKIDNVESFVHIEKLSMAKNQLLRMYSVCRLHNLRELNLAYNGILNIEGMKELINLQVLNLAGNSIKVIEHLNTNSKLEVINLAENNIPVISDLSSLKALKELYLHGNRLTHLRNCDKYLPSSIEVLTLAKNNISDLNEICTLTHLINLNSISVSENPCVQMIGNVIGFDYRPFVLNWCMSVKTIDGFVVNPIESLKAEWLYSQGRGRSFRVGEQSQLARYLSATCPLSGETLENENERKLRLILSKAQHHQRQLQEEIISGSESANNSPMINRKKAPNSRLQSPRFSRLGSRQGSPDTMSNSYHGTTNSSLNSSEIGAATNPYTMTTSLIENITMDNRMSQSMDSSSLVSPIKNNLNNSVNQTIHEQIPLSGCPLTAASKLMPVPESLMSPDCPPPNNVITQRIVIDSHTTNNSSAVQKTLNKSKETTRSNSPKHSKIVKKTTINVSPKKSATSLHHADNRISLNTSQQHEKINHDKLKTIRSKAAEYQEQEIHKLSKDLTDSPSNLKSVILIQKLWRGYRTRKKTQPLIEKIQKKRTQDYIEQLTNDMENTKLALENERKIQQLQMQAINALWKKVSSIEDSAAPVKVPDTSADDASSVVKELAKTCSTLTNQVQQLQGSMRDIINCMTMFYNLPRNEDVTNKMAAQLKETFGTQTDLIAVKTPQTENLPFPFNSAAKQSARPSTLALDPVGTISTEIGRDAANDPLLSDREKLDEMEKSTTNN